MWKFAGPIDLMDEIEKQGARRNFRSQQATTQKERMALEREASAYFTCLDMLRDYFAARKGEENDGME